MTLRSVLRSICVSVWDVLLIRKVGSLFASQRVGVYTFNPFPYCIVKEESPFRNTFLKLFWNYFWKKRAF